MELRFEKGTNFALIPQSSFFVTRIIIFYQNMLLIVFWAFGLVFSWYIIFDFRLCFLTSRALNHSATAPIVENSLVPIQGPNEPPLVPSKTRKVNFNVPYPTKLYEPHVCIGQSRPHVDQVLVKSVLISPSFIFICSSSLEQLVLDEKQNWG